MRLKHLVLREVRALGWDAEPEAPGPGWRADVLAVSPEGRRVVFKVQLSTQSNEETARRQQTLESSGCEVVWITRRVTTWFRKAPTRLVANVRDHPAKVTNGLWTFSAKRERFEQRLPVELSAVLRRLTVGDLVWLPDLRTAAPSSPAALGSRKWPKELGGGGWALRSRRQVARLEAELERTKMALEIMGKAVQFHIACETSIGSRLGCEASPGAVVALLAPLGQVRRVQAFTTKERTSFGAALGQRVVLVQIGSLVRSGEGLPPRSS